MAKLTTPYIYGDSTTVHTEKVIQLGTIAKDVDGNEYIFAQGVASTVLGSVVTIDEACVTALLATGGRGRIGVACGAINTTSKYGWYQIKGKNTSTKCLASVADNAALYTTATPGSVDDADVATGAIVGMVARSAESGGLCTTELNYPNVPAIAVD